MYDLQGFRMMKKIYRKWRNELGAMDKIIVTLLFVIIGVSAIIGLITWSDSQKDTLQTEAQSLIQKARDEAVSE